MNDPFRIYNLKEEERLEVFNLIDKNYKALPKKPDGSVNILAVDADDNDIDALRHSYVSGIYTMEYGEFTADLLGRLNELTSSAIGPIRGITENMDLWNNAIGRFYGKKAKTSKELFDLLMKALRNGEMIIDLKDLRKYKGEKLIKRRPKSLVIAIQETKTGENIKYYDINKKLVFSKEEFLALIKDGKYPDYSFKKVDGREFPISKRDRFKFNNFG